MIFAVVYGFQIDSPQQKSEERWDNRESFRVHKQNSNNGDYFHRLSFDFGIQLSEKNIFYEAL